ncbi:hypothetical protein SORBI_3001G521750 [Sorghum bicolor]|uniref:Uncharacterized protein n=1 Tax=Sorghum bicolor TaxID=4558 RepID=A0A1Z5SBP1_SORBI|nr:hypothetical protein SORBI_3001G521750 [Sorghum bicolor]
MSSFSFDLHFSINVYPFQEAHYLLTEKTQITCLLRNKLSQVSSKKYLLHLTSHDLQCISLTLVSSRIYSKYPSNYEIFQVFFNAIYTYTLDVSKLKHLSYGCLYSLRRFDLILFKATCFYNQCIKLLAA